MKKESVIKKVILGVVLSLLLNILIPAGSVLAAESNEVDLKEYQRMLYRSVRLEEETEEFVFDAELAVQNGLSELQAQKLEQAFNQMTQEEKMEILKSDSSLERVAPIVIWAAKIVGGWLASKLLSYGAKKFCQYYRNTNSATKMVCNVIG